jgi:hypothetical protein
MKGLRAIADMGQFLKNIALSVKTLLALQTILYNL